jgi:hypothetical protein
MIGKPIGRSGITPTAITPRRRGEARVRLHLPARIILLTGTERCILEDLSVTGAAVIPEGPLPQPGACAILQCEGVEAFGQVRWSRFGRCGVMFEDKLPLEQVVWLRHHADDFEVTERARQMESARAWVQGKTRIF